MPLRTAYGTEKMDTPSYYAEIYATRFNREAQVFPLPAGDKRSQIRRTIPTISKIQISGGLSNPTPLCQHLADLTDLPVHRPPQPEATAQGATYLALDGLTSWPPHTHPDIFHPDPNPLLQYRYTLFYNQFEQA